MGLVYDKVDGRLLSVSGREDFQSAGILKSGEDGEARSALLGQRPAPPVQPKGIMPEVTSKVKRFLWAGWRSKGATARLAFKGRRRAAGLIQ